MKRFFKNRRVHVRRTNGGDRRFGRTVMLDGNERRGRVIDRRKALSDRREVTCPLCHAGHKSVRKDVIYFGDGYAYALVDAK